MKHATSDLANVNQFARDFGHSTLRENLTAERLADVIGEIRAGDLGIARAMLSRCFSERDMLAIERALRP